jgi:hypothetical protein
MKNIAIIGGTGMLGIPVAKQLIKAGFNLTFLVRNENKARRIFGQNVQIIKTDLTDVNSLTKQLAGQDGLYLNLSVEPKSDLHDFQPESEGMTNIINAAKAAKVSRIGYLSSLVHFYQGVNGFNWWVFDIKQKAVQTIKNSGLAYSIFYPSTFMESFDKGAYRRGNAINLAGNSLYKQYLIAGEDYGRQVAKAFQLNNGNNNYNVQGLESYNAEDATKLVIDNYKKEKLKIQKLPMPVFKFLGKLIKPLNYGYHIVEAINKYPEKFESEKTWEELGKPEITFMEYIKTA